MDFFTVPTLRLNLLYCFVVIGHDRRRILHLNVTKDPTSWWVVQQLREAFPFESSPRFLIFDRDTKYGVEVPSAVRSLKIHPVRTSFESPWQNGIAERWVESSRRDLLDHIIAVNERHLSDCSRNISTITTKTAPTWDSGREHHTVPSLPV
jgi:putative transposase